MRHFFKELSVVSSGFLTLVFVGLILILVSCGDVKTDDALDSLSPVLNPSAHPPGTLLRDARGAFWMVSAWPERALVEPGAFVRSHLTVDDAVAMTSLESLCLRNRGRPWQEQERWSIVQHMPEQSYWYVNFQRKLRREAAEPVMQAWRDQAAMATRWNGTEAQWVGEYRDLGPMIFPDGALIRAEQDYALFFEGEIHAFASAALARSAGYPLSRAIDVPRSHWPLYGEIGEPLTAQVFTSCPLAMARARRDDDSDADGAPQATDCDDRDPQRAPHIRELCDGVDNNCDGIIDDGFPVNLPCWTEDHDCRAAGVSACSPDNWSVLCQSDDVLCE